MNDSNKNIQSSNAGYEKKDASGKSIIIYGVLGILLITFFSVLLVEYFSMEKEKVFDEMVLQPKSEAILKLRAREAEELSTYQLIDAEKEIYRIPIDSAIVIVINEANK